MIVSSSITFNFMSISTFIKREEITIVETHFRVDVVELIHESEVGDGRLMRKFACRCQDCYNIYTKNILFNRSNTYEHKTILVCK